MHFMLETDYTKPLETISEKLSFGGQMVLIGMGTVFTVLLLLWGALELFRLAFAVLPQTTGFQNFKIKLDNIKNKILHRPLKDKIVEAKAEKPAKVKPVKEPKPAKIKPAKPLKAAPAPEKAMDDGELIAVLTAAIAASEEGPRGSFRVVSFRRV